MFYRVGSLPHGMYFVEAHILQFPMHSYICTSFAGLHTLAGLAFAALLPFVAFAGLAALCCLCWHSCPPIPAWNSRAISLGSPSHMEIYSTPRHFTPVSIHLKNIYFSCSHINGLNMDLNLWSCLTSIFESLFRFRTHFGEVAPSCDSLAVVSQFFKLFPRLRSKFKSVQNQSNLVKMILTN